MTTIATLRALLTMDTSGFTDGAERASGASHKLRDNLDSVGRIGTMALAGAATGAAGLLGYGVKIAADMEQAKIGFTTMLGSAEKADAFIRDLQAFAAKTPFEFAGLQESASRLVAVGVESARVIPLMTVLGDATSAVGTGAEGIDRAVRALTQMQQKGKVTGEEMLQLVEAGIPAWDALAAKLGVDVATAQDKVSKGQVKVNDLFEAIEGKAGPALQRVSGMMDEQSRSFTGMLSNLKDTFDQQLGALAQPLMDALKNVLPALTGLVDTAIKAITPKLEEGVAGIKRFVDGFQDGVTGMKASGFVGLMQEFGDKTRTAFDWLIGHKELIIGAITAIGVVWTASMAQAAVATIAATWPLLLVLAAITGLVAAGIWIWNQYGEQITAVWNDKIKPAILDVYNNVFQPFWAFMQEKWNQVWQKGEELAAGFMRVWPTIQQALLDAYNNAIKPVFEFIASNQEMFKNLAVVLGIVIGIIAAFAVVMGVVLVIGLLAAAAALAALIVVTAAVVAVFMRLINIIWDVFNNVRDALGWVIDKIEEVIQFFWDLAQNVGSAIADAARWVWGLVTKVAEMASNVGNKIDEVARWFIDLPGRILGAIGDLGSLLYNAGKDVIQGLLNGIGSLVGAVRSKVTEIANSIPDWAKSILGIRSPSTVMVEVGRNVGRGLAQGLDASVSTVSAAAARMAVAAKPYGMADAANDLLAGWDRLRAGGQFGLEGTAYMAGGWGNKLSDAFYTANPLASRGDDPATSRQFAEFVRGLANGAPTEVRFTGDTSGAVATMFMNLQRTGQIQIVA